MKYINANDVYNEMRKHGFEAKYITRGEFVDHLPSADVAEVVYCKDCKHRDKNDVCTVLDIYAEGDVMVGDYFFCGKGERKEQNED